MFSTTVTNLPELLLSVFFLFVFLPVLAALVILWIISYILKIHLSDKPGILAKVQKVIKYIRIFVIVASVVIFIYVLLRALLYR